MIYVRPESKAGNQRVAFGHISAKGYFLPYTLIIPGSVMAMLTYVNIEIEL